MSQWNFILFWIYQFYSQGEMNGFCVTENAWILGVHATNCESGVISMGFICVSRSSRSLMFLLLQFMLKDFR